MYIYIYTVKMVPRPPPHPRLDIKNCHEAKTDRNKYFGGIFCAFVVTHTHTHTPISGVSKSSLPGETNIEKIRLICFPPPIPIPSVSQCSLPVDKK